MLWQRYPKPSHRPFTLTTKRPDVQLLSNVEFLMKQFLASK